MTAHSVAIELRKTLDTYFAALTCAGKPAPPCVQVPRAQYSAWLKTEGVAHYRGVKLVPRAERERARRTQQVNWVQHLDAQA